jgi:hypothetical protein
MTKGRLEAFSDGVIAIIITIMVLEIHPPHGTDIAMLKDLLPAFGSYVLSFIYVGIYVGIYACFSWRAWPTFSSPVRSWPSIPPTPRSRARWETILRGRSR